MSTFVKTKQSNLWRNPASGTYFARVKLNGRDHWATLRTKRPDQARMKLPKVLAGLRAGSTSHWSDLTLGICAAAFMARKRATGHKGRMLKPRSLDYRVETVEIIRSHWPGFDKALISSVTLAQLKAWADRIRCIYSGTRFNGAVESLRGMFQYALEQGACETNLALQIPRARVQSSTRFIPTREQFSLILSKLDEHPRRSHAALCIRGLAFTGLRPVEARNLTRDDIDLEKQTLLARVTKNGEPRTIPLIGQAVELFRDDLRAVLRAFRKSPRRALHTVCRQLGLPDMTPYAFRHLNLSRLIESGLDIRAAAEMAGHRDRGRTLLSTYAHTHPAHLKKQLKNVYI